MPGNGVASAHLMAQALEGEGEVGVVYHASDFFVTRQRYDAFKKTIADNYPNIKIVAEQGIGGPDFSGDAERAASAILTSNPTVAATAKRSGAVRASATLAAPVAQGTNANAGGAG